MKIIRAMLLLLWLVVANAQLYNFIRASDGDSVQCVDRNNQPAFQHYLLRHHKIQEKPSEFPSGVMEMRKKSKWQTYEAHVSTAKCPIGTVPVRQYRDTSDHQGNPETGTNTSATSPHEYAEISTRVPQKLYGTKATINIWRPTVEDSANELSISQIWIISGRYGTIELNTIEVGWHVCPGLYSDNKPRFFVYWTSDGYNNTGGYNLQTAGFIQTSNSIVLGGSITPISSVGGSQYEITVLVWKDPRSRNWWLSLGPNNTLVGYWPAEIFTSLADYATHMDWGGEIVDSHKFGRHTKTQMGSGYFPEEGFGRASYFRNLRIVDSNNRFQAIPSVTTEAEGTYYDIKIGQADEFFYGGPGFNHTRPIVVSQAHFVVVPLGVTLFCIYFSFSSSFSFFS